MNNIQNKPLISMIIPVYNRADEVDELLASFCRQTADNFDLNIVDDGSDDDLEQVIGKYSGKIDIRYFRQENKGPGEARNLGMKNADGDYFVFIDSDCSVPPDYIEKINSHLAAEDFDAFGGPDTYREDFPPFLKAVNYAMTSFIGTGGTRGSTGKSVAKYYPRSFNMGIKKEIFRKIGGMNKLRHGQDMDFSNRIYQAGFKVIFLPDVIVYHKRRTNLSRFFKQIFNWGLARINLGRIDKNMLKPVHSLPSLVLLTFLITIILSLLIRIFRFLLSAELFLLLLVSIFAFLQAARKYRSYRVGFLSVIVLFTQITAYALGYLSGRWKMLFSRKNFVQGFTKKYYK